ncbi:MAG: adenylyl-sulfate kinase [Alkaliphilus sp.]|nr:adenylyl-sulfate kinase [Alkaliphilus sp.]
MKNKNIVWHETNIRKEEREALLNQRGVVLWFTGLSGSGKSTIANAVEKKLYEAGRLTYLLDGDNIRCGLNNDLGFNLNDRAENIRRIAEVGKLFIDSGIITLVAFISPTIKDREIAKKIIGDKFIEIFVDCTIDTCIDRDPKGLYKKAKMGEIKHFTGIDSPYEKPVTPEIVVHSDSQSVDECRVDIIQYLISRGVIK